MFRKVTEGVKVLHALADAGIKLIFMSGANGSGKDLQGDLVEELMLEHHEMRVAHVGTSRAIRHHMKDEGPLGEQLRAARDNEVKGILFPDGPTLDAVATDVESLVEKKFNTIIINGIPRGLTQPRDVANIKNARFLLYEISLSTALKRAMQRSKQRLARGLQPRPDDNLPTVRNRWKDNKNLTVPAIEKACRRSGAFMRTINAEKSAREVLHETLKAMGVFPRFISQSLEAFDERRGRIAELMENIDYPDGKPGEKKTTTNNRLAGAAHTQVSRREGYRLVGCFSPGPGFKEVLFHGRVAPSRIPLVT